VKQGDAVVIERAANGWIVRPQFPDNAPINLDEIHVFQFLDYDHDGGTSEKCLFGFLLRHFAA
jgi:hypothetical protein